MTIWITSDWHFNHNKDFIYTPRGVNNVWDMNEKIITNHNSLVEPNDYVYVLGDLCLGGGSSENLRQCKKMIENMKGHLKIVLGNHDSAARIEMFAECWNVDAILGFADMIKYNKYHFYLSHFPTLTSNLDYDKPLKQRTLNLCGHTHTTNPFLDADKGYIYHCEVDAHECYPTNIEFIIQEFKNKYGQ